MKSDIIQITNDTLIDVEFYLKYASSKPIYVIIKKGCSYSVEKTEKELLVEKEDIWDSKHPLNFLMSVLYSFDLIFGNMMESVNLPYAIDFSVSTYNEKEASRKIFLSKVLVVKVNNIRMWKYISTVQMYIICILILLLGAALSFIFSGWYKVVFFVLLFSVGVYIYKKLKDKRDLILNYLSKRTKH